MPWGSPTAATGEVVVAFKRKRIAKKKSRRNFTRNALRVHRVNGRSGSVMRGGIRL